MHRITTVYCTHVALQHYRVCASLQVYISYNDLNLTLAILTNATAAVNATYANDNGLSTNNYPVYVGCATAIYFTCVVVTHANEWCAMLASLSPLARAVRLDCMWAKPLLNTGVLTP